MTAPTHNRRRRQRVHPARPGTAPPLVVDLADDAALDPSLVGAKAANLAAARRAGLPALPGAVLTTAATARLAGPGRADGRNAPLLEALADVWARVGTTPVVVRSSSPHEDGEHRSMAGRFRSVLDVADWSSFLRAVDDVVASAADVATAEGQEDGAAIAVLVQPQLEAACGGVLFGVDPVTGRRDRLVVAAVDGGPDRLVSGSSSGTLFELSRRGRLLRCEGDDVPGITPLRRRVALARLARRTAAVFGGPQDVEWAVDAGGRTWLLQSRPVTAVADAGAGPVLGPGPVAETFPEPLSTLEQDLWLTPLREGLARALLLSGAVSRRAVVSSPVVVAVGGRAAADLDLLAVHDRPRAGVRRLDPRPPARRLRAAWRTGRIRSALPALAGDLVATVDRELASVPPLDRLDPAALLGVLRGARRALVALHGQEVLVGMLLDADGGSGAAAALRALAEERAAGRTDAEIVAVRPEVLALAPPSIGPGPSLPPLGHTPPGRSDEVAEATALRESLRLRVRWVQELSARAAWRLGVLLGDPEGIRWLRWEELDEAVFGGGLPAELPARAEPPGAPLPAAFRRSADGSPVPVAGGAGAAHGAGGGRGTGTVVHDPAEVAPGSVLVTRTLDPALAASLPGLAGLVAETGSVLSHLAILARELAVPTVVGVAGALDRFPPGSVVLVDGRTGEVEVIDR